MKSVPRLLAIDIDGTLLDSKHQIPERNLRALKRAHSAGVQIALVTGRRHSFAEPIARELGFDVCLISSNGALTRSLAGVRFHCDLLPVTVARSLCIRMTEFRKHMVVTFDEDGPEAIVLEDAIEMNKSIRGWMEKNREAITFVQPIEEALTKHPLQAMFCGPIEHMARAEEHLLGWHEAEKVTVLKTQYDYRDLCILDILNQNCSKGHAVKRWADYHQIHAEEVVAIGDNYNDVEMLNFAGQAFIMENACAELKQNGWRQTASNNDCGVAEVIERVILN